MDESRDADSGAGSSELSKRRRLRSNTEPRRPPRRFVGDVCAIQGLSTSKRGRPAASATREEMMRSLRLARTTGREEVAAEPEAADVLGKKGKRKASREKDPEGRELYC
jgi:hypothetical protein